MSEERTNHNPLYEIGNSFGRFSFGAKLVILFPLLFALVILTTALQTESRTNSVVDAANRTTIPQESLYLKPSSASFRVGQNLSVTLNLNTMKGVNATEIELNYPFNYLEVSSVIINNQAFDVTVTNNFGGGRIHLVLGSTKPLTGDITVATINLKALAKGQTRFMFGSPINVLSFDTNLNIPISTINGRFNIR